MTRPTRAPHVAVFVSGHGFGHLTRTSAILLALVERRDVRLTVITAAPSSLWPRELARHTDRWLRVACDAGVVQADDLHVDAEATRHAVAAWGRDARGVQDMLVGALRDAGGVDCVIADIPPLAFEVARAFSVPSVAIANFSWDWIYESLGLPDAAADASRAYATATLLLELSPATPMERFPERRAIGVVGRRARESRDATRHRLGILENDRCVLLSLRSPALERVVLPPPRTGIRYLSPSQLSPAREDVVALSPGLEFLDALAASDLVLAKTGYSIIGDCAANAGRLLWARRQGFPEDQFLARWLAQQGWAAEVSVDSLGDGSWSQELERALEGPRASFATATAVGRAAAEIASRLP